MQDNRKTKTQLIEELVALRRRVAELESQPRSAPPPDSRVETPRDSEKRFQTFAGIAEREQAEVALRDSEARLRSLLENAPVRITALDRQGRFLALSHPLESDDTEANDAPNIFTFLEPDEQGKARRVLDQVFEQGVAAQYAGSIRLPTGDAAYFTHVAGPVWRDGQVVEAVVVSLDVTEQKHMEAVLRASEQRYKMLIENQGEGLGLVDANENFIFANPAADDLFGQPDGLMGHHLSEYLEADQFEVIQRETIVRQQGQKSTYELVIRRPDGQTRNLLITAVPQFDAQGAFEGTFGVFRDITARKQAEDEVRRLNAELEQRVIERTAALEKANADLQEDIHHRQRIEDMLRRSEHRYRTLFESAGDAIFILGLDGKILEVNRVACERLGYSYEELIRMDAALIHAPQFAPGVMRRIEQVRHLGSLAFESAHTRRDGTIIPIELNNSVIEYAGTPAILSIARDMTERKHAENRLRRYIDEQAALYEIALRLSAQLNMDDLLRLLVEQAVALLGAQAGGIYLYDAQRDRLALALGVDYFSEYLSVDLKPGEGLSGRAFQTRQVMKVQDYQTWEGRAAVFAHEDRLRLLMAVPLLGKHDVLGVLIVGGGESKTSFDDHDARLAELFAAQAAIALENAQLYERQQEQFRRLQDAQSRLVQAEKMSALGRLIASIVHEINNPLQAVQGCLTLVREGIDEATVLDHGAAANLQQDLDVAAAEVARVAGIVRRLRDFYRPTRAGVQPTDVQAVLNAVLTLTAKQLQHSRVSAERVVPTGAPIIITTNADQLKQVTLNLVLNALDAMPHGGHLSITVQLDTLPSGDQSQPAVRIDFADTGHGIPPEVLPRIFEPFYTTKDTGSGLGLSISYEIVKTLGGEITVSSELDHGSTFTIWLPVEADTLDTLDEASA